MGSEVEVLDVERGGRWCQVLLTEVTSASDVVPQAAPSVGVLSADLGPELPQILAALRPGLREVVCADSLGRPRVDGQDLAMRILEELGFGQDFVFTVPVLEDAIEYAVRAVLRPDDGGWEGRFVTVLGPTPVLDRARRHLVAPA